ncbi:hypothetical protein TWF173_008132 [Orbilia oligospora]|uniref:Uncharacterized protein n=1 Tax=Orbilia oligospora TaxID=2813651 RepID=A0A7C8R7H5_ORBOL|nr:hypothetical protein TWF970_006853 [Orbilia oligospora]KAF3311687.1 hypothetical protein TWF173_008132 [Orbilia oligospora]
MEQREAFDGSHDATVVSNKISRYMYIYMYNMRLEGAGLNVRVNEHEGTNRYTAHLCPQQVSPSFFVPSFLLSSQTYQQVPVAASRSVPVSEFISRGSQETCSYSAVLHLRVL